MKTKIGFKLLRAKFDSVFRSTVISLHGLFVPRTKYYFAAQLDKRTNLLNKFLVRSEIPFYTRKERISVGSPENSDPLVVSKLRTAKSSDLLGVSQTQTLSFNLFKTKKWHTRRHSRNCSTTLDTVFASTRRVLPTSLYEWSCASSITWFRKSLDSGRPLLKFLPNLFIVNAMSSVAKRWINQLRSFA